MKTRIISTGLLALFLTLFPYSTRTFVHTNRSYTNQAPTTVTAKLEFLSRVLGDFQAVDISGNYAYINIGDKLAVVDVTNKSSPIVEGQSEPLSSSIQDIFVAGDYAYVAAGNDGLYIVNVATPSNPTLTGYLPPTTSDIFWEARSVVVQGDYAYIAAYAEGLRVINVALKSNPYEVTYSDISGLGLDVAISGGYLYMAAYSGMHIYDISAPASPSYQTTFTDSVGNVNNVALSGNYAYLVANNKTYSAKWFLRVVDVTSPTSPVEKGKTADINSQIYDLSPMGSKVYIGYSNSMVEVQVSNPDAPLAGSGYSLGGGQPVSLKTASNYAFISGVQNFHIVDVTQFPFERMGMLSSAGGCEVITASGTHAYYGNGTQGMGILNVADRENPQPLSYLATSKTTYAKSIYLRGATAFVGSSYGLSIVDISDPTAPSEINAYLGGDIREMEAAGDYLFTTTNAGMSVADISDLSNPFWAKNLALNAWGSGLDLQGNTVYFADATSGVRAIDVSNPLLPYPIGLYDPDPPEPYFTDIVADGDTAYATDFYEDKLHRLDIQTATPTYSGEYAPLEDPQNLAIEDNPWLGAEKRFALIADGLGGVKLLEVTPGTAPYLIHHLYLPGYVENLSVDGSYVYVANVENGAAILWQLRDIVTGTLTTSGGSLFSTSGDTEIIVPNGAFTGTIKLNYRLLWTDQDTEDLVGIGHTIDIRAVYSDTGKTAHLAPGKSIDVVIHYTDTGMAVENTLAMYGWDASSAAWTQDGVSSILYAGSNQIEAEVEHLSMFAVLGETNRIWLPLVVK
jgi:hypothetical protein